MKHKIVALLAFLCYWSGVDRLFYFFNRKAKRIITFHNIIPEHLLPQGKRIGLTETADEFSMMICEIRKHFRLSTDVSDSSTVTITFDDGYLNQYAIACKNRVINETEGAIIFATGKMMNNHNSAEALIVDLLLHWTELADDGSYHIPAIHSGTIKLSAHNRSHVWQSYIWPAFVRDKISKGENLLKALDIAYPMDKVFGKCSEEYLKLRLTGISDANIEDLQRKGWLVGWHTQNHYPLSSLTIEEQVREIVEEAPEYMKDVVFSYPYGEPTTVNADSILIARKGGFPCAVSNISEVHARMGRYFLPRYMLSHNKYMLHFELSGIKHFIQSHRLLPVVG